VLACKSTRWLHVTTPPPLDKRCDSGAANPIARGKQVRWMAGQTRSDVRIVVLWAIALFAITAVGMAPLFYYRLDLSTLSFSTPMPVIVGIGIELTAYAPTLAALLVTGVISAAGGFKRLLRPVLRWRVGPQWYVIALLGPSLLFMVGDALRYIAGADVPSHGLTIPSAPEATFLIGALIAGSFGEELGWRGLGQPRLQSRYGALGAAVVVGALWSLWHLWPAVAPGGAETTTVTDVILTFGRLIATSIVYAWLLNSTGSLWIVMLAHAGHNLAVRFVPFSTSIQHGDPVTTILYAIVAAVVVGFAGARWLSRQRDYPQPSSGGHFPSHERMT